MAKTTVGKTYAQIVNGRAHWIFSASELSEYNENHIQVVDVTGNVPMVGEVWNGTAFVPYVAPPPSATELAEQALKAERLALKADTAIQAFIGMTPAQVIADVATIANLTDAKQAIRRLSLMVLILAKREFK